MKLKKTEIHRVIVTKRYDIEDWKIIEAFGSIDRVLEEIDESDEWFDFINDQVYDVEDNWISDSKGYTEVNWEVDDDNE